MGVGFSLPQIYGWAYVLVVAGIWFTVAPWRFRDFLAWGTATEQ